VAAKTRKSRTPKPDDRNRVRAKIGGRSDYRVFTFSASVSSRDADARIARLREVYEACGGWNDLSNFIAEPVRKGEIPVPLPPSELSRFLGVRFEGWVRWRSDLVSTLPSIPWAALGETSINPHVLGAIRHVKMNELNQAAEVIAGIDLRPNQVSLPVSGTLQEALKAYDEYIKSISPSNFDRQGKIRQLQQRHNDIPLAALGLDACRSLIDYWRQRPHRHDGKGQYSIKRSREQLAELDRFFEWLHLTDQFKWREPEDFQRIDRAITRDGSIRKSILDGKMPIFNLTELASLVRNSDMPERLWIVWCLNTSHGAAEVGRVQWEDLYLNQDHPWTKDGLKVGTGGDWIGFLRPKTDVLGWWKLWPETVELLMQWKQQCTSLLGRDIRSSDRIILRESGNPLYNDDAKNGQSGFYTQFSRLKNRCEKMGFPVRDLPPGTLRNQFPDWCGGDEGDATVASVALCHGIPHRGDKLIYKHYSNRPWQRLFEKQEEFRQYCRPVLDVLGEAPPLPLKVRQLIELWPKLTGSRLNKVRDAAGQLNVSIGTVYRYLGSIEIELN